MSTATELKAEAWDQAVRGIRELGELAAPDTVGDVVVAVALIRKATAAGYVIQIDAARSPAGDEEWQVRFTRDGDGVARSEPTLAQAVCAADHAAAMRRAALIR